MKKTFWFGTLIFALVAISLASINHQQQNVTPVLSKSSDSPKDVTQDNSCHDIDNVTKKLPANKDDNSYIRKFVLTTLVKDSDFLLLEKSAQINNQCGADAASYLVNLYAHVNELEKANEHHQKVINYANSNNTSAISNLCDGYDSLVTSEQKLHFCQMVLDDKTQKFNDTIKFAALTALSSFYFDLKQGDKLFELCEKSKEKDICMFSNLFTSVNSLALKLYEEKNYEESFKLFKKIEPYDVTGLTQSQLGDMYQNGEGTIKNTTAAIFWYKKALEKNYNPKIRPGILNNMGVAYEDQLDYTSAFQCYQNAATMDYPLSQMNLALMYSKGYGTLQDTQQAYAWISIAISKGLEDRDKQTQAEKIKNWLTYSLRVQDQTGAALKQAQALTQQYYKEYVLHEKITTNDNKSFKFKIKEAIKTLTN